MITELRDMPDWHAILEQIGWADAPGENLVEEEVHRELTRGLVTFEEQSGEIPVEKGCRVTIKTSSTLPKYNREKTVVTVGSRLYDAGIESLMCGMRVGQEAQTMVKGEIVRFTICKVEKKCYPTLSDALVQNLSIDGIGTLSKYRSFVRNRQRSAYADTLCEEILAKLLPETVMDDPAAEDIRKVIDAEYEPLRVRFSLDQMDAATWEKDFGNASLQEFYAQIYPDVALIFGTKNKESFYEKRTDAAKNTIRHCLILRAILSETSEETDPTMALHAEKILTEAMKKAVLDRIYGGN